MSKQKHAPGPWKYYNRNGCIEVTSAEGVILDYCPEGPDDYYEEEHANAMLIANDADFKAARQAIAKAEGGEE